jgi:hypothetical protein
VNVAEWYCSISQKKSLTKRIKVKEKDQNDNSFECDDTLPSKRHPSVCVAVFAPYPRQDSNLSKCKDIADYLARDDFQSDAPIDDSEPEDDTNLVLQLPDKY